MPTAVWIGEFSGGAVGRHAALIDFCARQLRTASNCLALAHDDFGAPLLLLDGAPSGWRISSSSRENVALFGLSHDVIGVDVEVFAAMEPAWNILHGQEKAALEALPEDLRPEEFLRLWTAKEAYLKALGIGLRREPSEICACLQADTFQLFDKDREIAFRDARLWREKVGGRDVLCACVTLAGQ